MEKFKKLSKEEMKVVLGGTNAPAACKESNCTDWSCEEGYTCVTTRCKGEEYRYCEAS